MYHTHELINEVLSCCSFATEVCVWKMWKRNDCHSVNLHFSIENWKVHFWFLIKDANCTVQYHNGLFSMCIPCMLAKNYSYMHWSFWKVILIFWQINLKMILQILFFFLFTPQNLSLITPWWRQNSFEADLV